MPRMEQRLKSPDRKKLALFIEVCQEALDLANEDNADPEAIFCSENVAELKEILEWCLTFLCNRSDYHKTMQRTRKMEHKLLLDRALARGIDVEALRRQARGEAIDQIIDESDELPVQPPKGGSGE